MPIQITHTLAALNVGDTMSFQDCLVQTQGAFGVRSIHCKTVTIHVRAYAQYPKALAISYLEKGKRKPAGFWVSGSYGKALVLPVTPAAEPKDGLDTVTENGFTSKRSRYGSCDPRYFTDHIEQLEAAAVEPLFYLNNEA